MTKSTQPTNQTNTPGAPLSVVGLGASAGGLRALSAFFDAIPADTEMTFVVITHLSPDHESMMAELLQSHMAMPVRQVSGYVKMAPNQVYVIPPGKRLVVTEGHLDLEEFDMPRGRRFQIDTFFQTLAEQHGDGAAIILSGTGSDGAVGIQHIKERGGLILAQDPAEAEFNAMPQSAIATGLVDIIAPVAQLASQLMAAKQTRAQLDLPADPEGLTPAAQETFAQILDHVHQQTGHNFAGYRWEPLLQRIGRRMQLAEVQTLSGYLQRLRNDDAAVDALYHDLVIHLTEFFRDGAAWAALAEQVIPQFFVGKGRGDSVRVWTVGCAHGEAAYSIGILLMEHAATLDHPPQIQIFASDLCRPALDFARQGIYPEAIAATVSEERLARFFVHENNHFRIRQSLRDRVVFAHHNLLQDPPFSRLDLIICRNVLGYLERAVQEQVYAAFHYALGQTETLHRYLFLGATDVAGEEPEEICYGERVLFEPLAGTHPIFRYRQQQSIALHYPLQPPTMSGPGNALPTTARGRTELVAAPQPADAPADPGETHRLLLEELGPPSLLVDEQYHVLHLSESVGRFLRVPGGALTSKVTRLVHMELQQELQRALDHAFTTGQNSYTKPVLVHFEGTVQPVALLIQPSPQQGRALILFFAGESTAIANLPINVLPDDVAGEVAGERAGKGETPSVALTISRLRQRLAAFDFGHAAMVEELRTANAELQSANEEYRALLSELEVNKEELRSTNEELRTVNDELAQKVQQSSETYTDIQNFLLATEIGALYLDRDLRVVRYTAHAADLFNLIPSDRGRPIEQLRPKLHYTALARDASRVLADLVPITRDIESVDGYWYLVSLRPYRTIHERIEGVVITLVDITANKQTELALRDAKAYAESIVQTIPDAVLVLGPDLRVQSANEAFYAIFQVHPNETEGRLIYELGNHQWDIPALRTLLEDILPDNQIFTGYEVTHRFEGIGRRTMLLNGRRLEHTQLILLAITDITERKEAEEALQANQERQAFLLRLSDTLRPLADPIVVQAEACRLLGEHLGVDRAYYVEVDAAAGQLRVQQNYLRGDSPSLVGLFPLAEFDWAIPYLQRGETLIVADSQTNPIVPDADRGWMANLQMHAHISTPVNKEGALMGALCVTEPAPRAWTGLEVELMRETAERLWATLVRAETEAALRESEARHRTLFDAVDEGVCLFERLPLGEDSRRDYRYLAMNPAMQAMFGIPDLSGQSIRDNFPDEVEDWYDDYDHVLETGESIRVERESVLQGLVLEMFVTTVEDGSGERLLAVMQDVTKRKRAEEALRASEERYRLLVESAQEYAIFMLDLEGCITSWNTGAERIFGYSEAEAIGLDARAIFTEEDRAAGIPETEMATAQREGQASDDRWHVRQDGSRFWANGVMEALRQPDGTLRGFAKVLRDNTEPKKAADALEESQQRYQQALEAAQLGTWRYDVVADINYFDERSQEIFGLERATYTAAEVDPFMHPDDLSMIVQARTAALDPDGDGTCHYVHRIIHPDGAVRWVRLNCQVIFAGEGADRHPVQAVGVITDVTERREAANALRASEQRFRALVDASAQIVWTTDPNGVVVEDSPSWRAVTGQSYEEFVGRGWMDVVHPEDQSVTVAAWQQAVATVIPHHVECRIYHAASDQYRWNTVRAVPLQNADGTVRGWVGMNSDIQQRKEAEAALYALNETLEAQVRERTAQVRDLVTQLTMSEQDERHRISQVLHDDLQQRLYSLRFQLLFLRNALDEEFTAAQRADMIESVETIDTMLEETVAAMRSLSVELSPPVLEGEGLVEALGWLATQMQTRHGLTVHVKAAAPLPPLKQELRILLFQTMRELLFNIVKHAGVTEAEVTLQHQNQQLQIVIIDRGIGFDTDASLNATESHGLWQSQQRLRLIGGRMHIESNVGDSEVESGTQITIVCPCPLASTKESEESEGATKTKENLSS